MYNKELKQVDVDLMDMTNLQIMTALTCVTTYQCFLNGSLQNRQGSGLGPSESINSCGQNKKPLGRHRERCNRIRPCRNC